MTLISMRPEVFNWACMLRLQFARFRGTHLTTSVLEAATLHKVNPEVKVHHVVNRLGLVRQRHLSPRPQRLLGENALYFPDVMWPLSQKLPRMP